MKKVLPVKTLTLKEQIKVKRDGIRAIVKVMANKPSYERLRELNKQLAVELRELDRIEVRANLAY